MSHDIEENCRAYDNDENLWKQVPKTNGAYFYVSKSPWVGLISPLSLFLTHPIILWKV